MPPARSNPVDSFDRDVEHREEDDCKDDREEVVHANEAKLLAV
jgi:hypothetical protein